jgi:alpha-tubulin suppressor-like RCC1 family protein
MKRTLSILSSFAVLAFAQSCKKDASGGTISQVVIDTAIAPGTVYSLNLSTYGNTAVIKQQATQFSTSQVISSGGAITYRYSSSSIKAAATDQVVLAVANGKGGNRGCGASDSTIVTVNFTGK